MRHVVRVVRFRPPRVECACGWMMDAPDVFLLEVEWRGHMRLHATRIRSTVLAEGAP